MPSNDPGRPLQAASRPTLLVLVPGMGIKPRDFHAKGLVNAVVERHWPVTTAIVDPGPDSYLDGSVVARLLDGISQARHAVLPSRVWLAGISLGCQGILRCIQAQPDLADGLILLTPYLASTGLIAEVVQAGGLHNWATSNASRDNPERALLTWLARSPPGDKRQILIGRALGDRFVATANLLADQLPLDQVVSVSGKHDWESWRALWRLILDQNPFASRIPQQSIATA